MNSGGANHRLDEVSGIGPAGWLAALVVVSTLLFRLPAQDDRNGSGPAPASRAEARLEEPIVAEGRELARTACGTCHVLPAPEIASREQWAFEILPDKRVWVGLDGFDFAGHPGGDLLAESPVFPERPVVSPEEWSAICNYYLSAAPADGGVRTPSNSQSETLSGFEVIRLPAEAQPQNTFVSIDSQMGVFYVGNARESSLDVYAGTGQRLISRGFGSPPSATIVQTNALILSLIGNSDLSDESNGGLVRMPKPGPGGGQLRVLDDQLRRPMDLAMADLNADGREDIIVAERGGYLGLLSWMENKGNGYQVHPLLKRAGAVAVEVGDVNGDSKPDIVAVTRHGFEALEMFLNQGDGRFERSTIATKHPRWWFSDLCLADVNGDGILDLVTANGGVDRFGTDAVPLMADHGITVWMGDGSRGFQEQRIHHLNRARRVVAADFDGDGDIDVAAVGYSHQPGAEEREGFVLLRNLGEMGFRPFNLVQGGDAFWSDLDAGDLDGDGDVDLVLVADHPGNSGAPPPLLNRWMNARLGMLVLRNQQQPQATQ